MGARKDGGSTRGRLYDRGGPMSMDQMPELPGIISELREARGRRLRGFQARRVGCVDCRYIAVVEVNRTHRLRGQRCPRRGCRGRLHPVNWFERRRLTLRSVAVYRNYEFE